MKNSFANLFKSKHFRAWFIVSCVLITLIIVVSAVAATALEPLLNGIWGRPRRIVAEGSVSQYFEADFETKEDARLNGEAVNERACEEGFVLLKNKNNDALPVSTSASAKKRVSVFGKNSVRLVTGGTGSGGGSGEFEKNIFQSLEAAHFEYNDTLKRFYDDHSNNSPSGKGRDASPQMKPGQSETESPPLATGETPWTNYTDSVKSSFAEYKDLALIVISRIGGEGWDLPRIADPGGSDNYQSEHYLQLDKHETALIQNVCNAGFIKVVVLINCAVSIEAGFIDANDKIDAALWIGTPGDTGIMALGRILNGTVNPSGRTPDTYARHFKNDPAYVNFSTNGGNLGYTGSDDNLASSAYKYIDYEEGIYIGYRYYETRDFEERRVNPDSTWYDDNVVYPFGYGKSYTTFTQEIVNKSALNGAALTPAGKIPVQVKITNTGERDGRDTVQIYVTAPYDKTREKPVEKSHVVLAGFAKTPVIKPGVANAQTVTVEIDPYYFASYDFDGRNSSDFQGFLLESGSYEFKLSNNAHEVIDSFTQTLDAAHRFGGTVNRFGDADDELVQQLSRKSFQGSMPEPRSAAEKRLSGATKAAIDSVTHNRPDPSTEFPIQGEPGTLKFKDLVETPYGDPLWDDLVNQISVADMVTLVGKGAFTTAPIMDIGKPATVDADGPAGFVVFLGDPTIYGTSHYAGEPVFAATFNTERLFDMGKAVGNEGLIGNQRGDGAPYSGWYAPGVNLHRSPFGGRGGEYFSEDPFLSGMLAAHQIMGAAEKGVYTQVKHFAVNDQETFRSGGSTWLTEQALREIYLRPFEMTVKIGKTMGMMSSFNRIGTKWTGGDYRLLTEVLRNEWGFQGMVICDYHVNEPFMDAKQMHYAGGDLHLQTGMVDWKPNRANAADLNVLRDCTKHILYTVSRSNAMNADVIGYRLPVWQVVMIVVDVALVLGLALWGFLLYWFQFRSKPPKSDTKENSGRENVAETSAVTGAQNT